MSMNIKKNRNQVSLDINGTIFSGRRIIDKSVSFEFYIDASISNFNTNIFGGYVFDDIDNNISAICLQRLWYISDINCDLVISRSSVEILINKPLTVEDYYTFNGYLNIIQTVLRNNSQNMVMDDVDAVSSMMMDTSTDISMIIRFNVKSKENISATIKPIIEFYTKSHIKALDLINETYLDESIQLVFDFPDDVRVACEQYLVYFSKFLHNLGIDASASIKEQAGKVLFSVTPNSETEALEAIREALGIYLNLPVQYHRGDLTIIPTNLEHQQLVGNIQHLQSQLTFAMAMGQAQQATIQAHQATIEAQKITIVTQQQILNGEVFVHSVQSVTPAADDKEDLLGGLVQVGQAELIGGVSFNLAEVIRRWRRRWGRSE